MTAFSDDIEFAPELPDAAPPFTGLTHDEVLALDLPHERYLIEDLVPKGAVGTYAAVPETGKSWLAHKTGVVVARGEGEIFGRPVASQANVGYFWQDDSTREEAERVKIFERVHANPPGLPLRWFLNEGLSLPRDIERLRHTIVEYDFGLVILDSFYNLLAGTSLKDEGAEQIVALLKLEIADATGCTVLFVDHMAWANDTNRARLRPYGGVFKSAATRFGIYIDAVGKSLSIEARGNNIRGFKKTPAYWDADKLELRLVETTDHDQKVEERADAVLDYLQANAGTHSKTAIRKAVGGRAEITDQALELLKTRDRAINLSERDGTGVDGTAPTKGWIATIHAETHPVPAERDRAGQLTVGSHDDYTCPLPYKGTGVDGTGLEHAEDVDHGELERILHDPAANGNVDQDEIERLAWLATVIDEDREIPA